MDVVPVSEIIEKVAVPTSIIIKQGCRKTGSPETKALIHVCQKR